MNWHNVAILWTCILLVISVLIALFGDFTKNLWLIVGIPVIPALILATLLVGGIL